jgi:hypothetical protein
LAISGWTLPKEAIMDTPLTVGELEARWEQALQATRTAMARDPESYRQLKLKAADIVDHPVDIKDYFPAVEELVALLHRLDPCGRGSIFDIFTTRISPSDIWHVKMLRMECKDLLAHLRAFDRWRREQHHLHLVK